MPSTAVLTNAYVITVDEERRVIPRGYVRVAGERIDAGHLAHAARDRHRRARRCECVTCPLSNAYGAPTPRLGR